MGASYFSTLCGKPTVRPSPGIPETDAAAQRATPSQIAPSTSPSHAPSEDVPQRELLEIEGDFQSPEAIEDVDEASSSHGSNDSWGDHGVETGLELRAAKPSEFRNRSWRAAGAERGVPWSRPGMERTPSGPMSSPNSSPRCYNLQFFSTDDDSAEEEEGTAHREGKHVNEKDISFESISSESSVGDISSPPIPEPKLSDGRDSYSMKVFQPDNIRPVSMPDSSAILTSTGDTILNQSAESIHPSSSFHGESPSKDELYQPCDPKPILPASFDTATMQSVSLEELTRKAVEARVAQLLHECSTFDSEDVKVSRVSVSTDIGERSFYALNRDTTSTGTYAKPLQGRILFPSKY